MKHAAALATAALALTAPATAAWQPDWGPRAARIATAYWQAQPNPLTCPNLPWVAIITQPPGNLPAAGNFRVEGQCYAWLDVAYALTAPWWMFCGTVVHETGHLLGHTPDEGPLLSPIGPYHVSACQETRALPRHRHRRAHRL